MRWLVGLDLRPYSRGAIDYASWLRTHGEHQRLTGLHVIERGRAPSSGIFDGDALMSSARFQAERVLEEAGVRSDFDDIGVEFGDTAEGHLQTALLGRDADGLIVGRRAATDKTPLVRLGRVARRLLRYLPVPTIVTPPDLDAESLGDGPVIALTDLQADAVAGVHFAQKVAQSVRRPLVLAYTVSLLDHLVVYMPSESYKVLEDDVVQSAAQELSKWCDKYGFGDHEQVVSKGRVVDEARKLAEDRNACLLVCGSRGFSAVERVFIPSVGSELAAASRIPVAVVPADYPEQPD